MITTNRMKHVAVMLGLCLLVAGAAACASHFDRLSGEDATAAASHLGCGVALTVVALGMSLSFPPLTGRPASGGELLRLSARSVSPFRPPERLA